MKDGGLGGQGDEAHVAVEDEGERQKQQPDEGVGTRETDTTKAPQRERGDSVEDESGERASCETPVRELPANR